ncbi:hypothetical protein H257_18556 [Aphanomyces astaci]|uniref:Uncharacterized protein n=1 Tax=Aphanomyces astaci TaxID=112090 RepID=W4FD01_APHAT|nr:hypothetical protein H257_18556 [Aphanomyces astaci]ETV64568.1 hypothetical protein H257_18556 [Aphanomyces astaci]|eukprot:XP_009845949.1 hypothetical protein H257_18556 [Aphanomyces astaci]
MVGLRPQPTKRVQFYSRVEYVFDALEVTASIPLTDLESTRYPGEVWRLNWHCFSPRRKLTRLAFQHLVHFAEKASSCASAKQRHRYTPVCSVTAMRIPPAADPTSGRMNPFLDTEALFIPSVDDEKMREGNDVWTQQTYPRVICPAHMKPSASNGSVDEIPVNWEGSDLSLDQREVLRKLLLQFDIFVTTSKAPGRTNLVKCHVNTGNASPIKQALADQTVNEAMGSPVLMIRKPHGSIRFCIAYRKLNDVTIKDC